MFPFQPTGLRPDARGLYTCQDPILRSKILPLFRFDPRELDRRPIGHGTTFRIDPWAHCATAFHVVEELFDVEPSRASQLVLREDVRLTALQIEGLIYGLGRFSADAWRPIEGASSIFGIESPPFQVPRVRNSTELMMLRIPRSPDHRPDTPYLSVDLTRWHPRIGELVLAFGFADLDTAGNLENEQRPMSQYIYGSFARIIEIERADGSRGRPWPQFRVSAEWPGGMSGGPVFNEAGNVVGIVSAGIEGQGIASATFFSGWDIPTRVFPTLDRDNPGRFMCFAALDAAGEVVRIGLNRAAVEAFAAANAVSEVVFVSIEPNSREYIHVNAEQL